MASQSTQIVVFFTIICLLVLLLIGFIVSIVFLYQKKSISYLTDIEKMKVEHERTLLKTQLEIQESTLQNISREIHDNIGLTLTLAKLTLNTSSNGMEVQNKKSYEAVQLITNAIDGLRSLSRTLNSDYVLNNGLIKSLEKELSYFKSIKAFNLDLKIIGNPIYLEASKELVIFRIAQEAYNNAIKHSNASKISTIIEYKKTCFLLKIIDNGKGFNYDDLTQKSGLNNMIHRSQLLKGNCNIESNSTGTTINLSIPY